MKKGALEKVRVAASRLEEHKTFLKEEAAESMRRTPGMLACYAAFQKG